MEDNIIRKVTLPFGSLPSIDESGSSVHLLVQYEPVGNEAYHIQEVEVWKPIVKGPNYQRDLEYVQRLLATNPRRARIERLGIVDGEVVGSGDEIRAISGELDVPFSLEFSLENSRGSMKFIGSPFPCGPAREMQLLLRQLSRASWYRKDLAIVCNQDWYSDGIEFHLSDSDKWLANQKMAYCCDVLTLYFGVKGYLNSESSSITQRLVQRGAEFKQLE